jgi:hypothetical protein
MAQVKTTIKIPTQINQKTAQTIAQDLVDFIVERTKDGKGKDGKPFPRYSESYKKSLDFKIAGKGTIVDLTLTGEMLDTLKVLEVKRGQIVIGFEPDDDINGRAEGNILGSYGGEPDPKKARNFLDVSDKEIANILREYPIDNARERLNNLSASELARVLASEISDSLEFDDEA